MTALAELGGDLPSLSTPRGLASRVGLRPGNNPSAGKRFSGAATRGGKALKRIAREAAAASIRTKRCFKVKFGSLRPRLGCVKSLVAIAHKIIKVMWHVITKKEPCRDDTVDLEALLVKLNLDS
jgi:transposase